MQLRIKSYLSSLRISRLDTYKSIDDLTLDIWGEIHETGDVSLLIKNKFKLTEAVVSHCSDLWDDIRQEQLDKFGVPEAYKDYLRKIADLALAKLQYAISDDRTEKLWIRIAQANVDEILNQPKQSIIKTLNIIEVSLGLRYPISPSDIVVSKYFNYLELVQEKSKHGQSN